MENLKEYLKTFTELSEESWIIFKQCLKESFVNKGTELLSEGKVCNSIFFINSGFCKSYYALSDGREINTAFYFENDFFTNIKSLRSRQKSEFTILACEKTEVIEFDRKLLLEAYNKSPQIESLGRKILEIIIEKQEEHNNILKLLTPKERYEYLILNYPHVSQRVSLTQISSYLGISRETLSRIRKKI